MRSPTSAVWRSTVSADAKPSASSPATAHDPAGQLAALGAACVLGADEREQQQPEDHDLLPRVHEPGPELLDDAVEREAARRAGSRHAAGAARPRRRWGSPIASGEEHDAVAGEQRHREDRDADAEDDGRAGPVLAHPHDEVVHRRSTLPAARGRQPCRRGSGASRRRGRSRAAARCARPR